MQTFWEEFFSSLQIFFEMFSLKIKENDNNNLKIFNNLDKEVGSIIIKDKELSFATVTAFGNLTGNILFSFNEDSFNLVINYQLGECYQGTFRVNPLILKDKELMYIIENSFSFTSLKKSFCLDFSDLSFDITIVDGDTTKSYKYLENRILGNILMTYFLKQKGSNYLYDKFIRVQKKDEDNLEVFQSLENENKVYKVPITSLEVVQKGNIFQELEPSLFTDINSIRTSLEKEDLSLLDNLIGVSLNYSKEEIESLLGISLKEEPIISRFKEKIKKCSGKILKK